jgi:acetoacetyl-CoA synthetase
MANDFDPKTPLWQPSSAQLAQSQLEAFRQFAAQKSQQDLPDYEALHAWSIREAGNFWSLFWDWAKIRASKKEGAGPTMPKGRETPLYEQRFFPEARLNFAENLLWCQEDRPAIEFWGEERVKLRLSYRELYALVSRLVQAMQKLGIGPGDRVAGLMPNMPHTVAAMLAAASLGAIWSSASPDFGVQGALDRFGQISPKLLFGVDGYYYAGKAHATGEKLAAIKAALPSLSAVIIVPYAGADLPGANMHTNTNIYPADMIGWEEWLSPYAPTTIPFAQLPFDHPLYILFSSGTTGVPKCLLHGAGGTLLQQVKEHRLHCNIKAGEKIFYYTTCGWMMWNWLVAGLASGACLLLYDGSPFFPDANILWDYCSQMQAALFGTSAKYLDALSKAGWHPLPQHDLRHLRLITSTGSPLMAETFAYVYKEIKSDMHLASISGGTDILSCFVLGVPTLPVWAGEIQGAGLGMAVDVVDKNGRSLAFGEKGELVCRAAFPSMPVSFWGEGGAEKYQQAYFSQLPGLWYHGDYCAKRRMVAILFMDVRMRP